MGVEKHDPSAEEGASPATAPAQVPPIAVHSTAHAALPANLAGGPASAKQKMAFLKEVRDHALSIEEAASTTANRFLIEEMERLDEEVKDLRQYRDKFYQNDKEVSLLQAQARQSQTLNLRDAGILAIGSAGLGAAPSYIEVSSFGWIFFILSALLVIVSFFRPKQK